MIADGVGISLSYNDGYDSRGEALCACMYEGMACIVNYFLDYGGVDYSI